MVDLTQAEKLSDEEIVNLTLENQENFLFIINRYKSKLFNYIMRLTNIRDEDAEDLLQEVFLKIYLNLNDFDRDLKFSTWAYAITRNQVISNHRKLSVRAEGHAVTIEDDNVKEIKSNFDIKDDVDANFLKEKIAKVFEKMDKKYSDVLILKFLEQKDYKEISDIIKKPIGTVGSLMNKAKQEFRKELKNQNIKL
jgi:RNA polymerase sigma-70 factor, ECF subfamily